MQRWFFLEDPNNAALRATKGNVSLSTESRESIEYPPRKWLFSARVPDLTKEETVCVIGDVSELGSWQPDKCVPLEREEDTDLWSTVIEIPEKRRWNLDIAVIDANAVSPTYSDEPHDYGNYDNLERIDRGWLNKETIIQLKLCNNPLTLFRPKYYNRTINIKVTPVNLARHNSFPKSMSEALDESLSAETQDTVENPKHAFTEVASLSDDDPTF
ncbi:hypothetical protein NQ314_009207 [Rhamnusium bicolor]|uniref:CBM20 domain-containing protein n=1 Tax=Rhamnusium bicolor TaxID=1586634 RepID=A0AAV8Y443_9CUCU|nr:hypothetical protein NQ314_009207 [Rhamnusium bicolor]